MPYVWWNLCLAVCLGWLVSATNVAAQEPLEPTEAQLKAAQEGFKKIGAKYTVSLNPKTFRVAHVFSLPFNMPDVGKLTSLNTLCIRESAVTERGSRNLAGLKKLVYREAPSLSDEGLKIFTAMLSLTHLMLHSFKLTDRGLGELQAMPNLRHLTIENAKFSEEAIAAFQKAVPKCIISRERLYPLGFEDYAK